MAKPTAVKAATTLASVPTEPPAKRGPGRPPGSGAKPKAPKKGKPTQWAKWGHQAERIVEMNRRLGVVALASPALGTALNNTILSDESMEEIALLVTALQKLDADRVEIPAIPKAPKAPPFAVGDKVKLSKKAAASYLESGIYTAADLDNLEVIAVGKKGILSSSGISTAELQVFVRSARQLEKR